MASLVEMVRHMESTRFHEVLSASPKAFREEVFRKGGVKIKAGAFSLQGAPKNVLRTQKLLAAIQDGFDLGDDILAERDHARVAFQ